MKALLSIAIYGTLVLFSASMSVYGIYSMISDAFNNGDIGRGFLFFSLGTILIGVAAILYTLGAVLENLKSINTSLIPMILQGQGGGQPKNPFEDLMNQIKNQVDRNTGIPKDFPLSGSMTIAKMNEDGTITPLEKREFSSPEEMRQFRDEMLNKAFANKNKKLEDMSVQELEAERVKAVDEQDFELAAAIRDLINQKEDTK
jgi:hypothetical protein